MLQRFSCISFLFKPPWLYFYYSPYNFPIFLNIISGKQQVFVKTNNDNNENNNIDNNQFFILLTLFFIKI